MQSGAAVATLALAESRFDRVVSLGEQSRTQYPASPLLDQIDQHLGRGYLKQRQYAKAMRILKPLTQTASVGDLPAAAGTWNAPLATRKAVAYLLQETPQGSPSTSTTGITPLWLCFNCKATLGEVNLQPVRTCVSSSSSPRPPTEEEGEEEDEKPK